MLLSDEIYSLISLVASIFRMKGLFFSGSLHELTSGATAFAQLPIPFVYCSRESWWCVPSSCQSKLSNFNPCSFPFSYEEVIVRTFVKMPKFYSSFAQKIYLIRFNFLHKLFLLHNESINPIRQSLLSINLLSCWWTCCLFRLVLAENN